MSRHYATSVSLPQLGTNPHINAVLFDRDGVLTFFDGNAASTFFRPLLPISLGELALRWQNFGEIIGFPRNLVEEKSFFHHFWDQLSDEFQLSLDQRTVLGNLDYTSFVVPYSEVHSVLAQLHANNIRLGVLSNFSLASLEQSLVTTRMAKYFDIICAATVIGAAKPSAKAYQIAIDALQVKPEQCLFFDDERMCVDGAREAGLQAYLVDRQAPRHNLEANVVNSLVPVPLLALRP